MAPMQLCLLCYISYVSLMPCTSFSLEHWWQYLTIMDTHMYICNYTVYMHAWKNIQHSHTCAYIDASYIATLNMYVYLYSDALLFIYTNIVALILSLFLNVVFWAELCWCVVCNQQHSLQPILYWYFTWWRYAWQHIFLSKLLNDLCID